MEPALGVLLCSVRLGSTMPASPCAKYEVLVRPAGIVTVIELEPATVAVVASSNWFGSLLVSVTGWPPAGAGWPVVTVQAVWRFTPMVTPSHDKEKPCARTL